MLTVYGADLLRAHAHEEACPTCDRIAIAVMEDVPRVLFVSPAYAVLRSAFFASLRELQLVGGQKFDAFLAMSPFERAASLFS